MATEGTERAVFDGPAAAKPQLVQQVEAPVDRSEVIRYVGYPGGTKPTGRLNGLLQRWIPEAAKRARPQAVYAIFPVSDLGPRWLRVSTPAGTTEFRGAIGEFLGVSRYVAAFIATAGPDVERLSSELMRQGEPLAALIVGAVGSERAEAAEEAVIERLRPQAAGAGLALTLPYSPGYCGMAVTEQRPLFSLFGDQTAGVSLTPDCLMRPLKSVSGLIGLGPPDEVEAYGSPCDRCELKNCNMRR